MDMTTQPEDLYDGDTDGTGQGDNAMIRDLRAKANRTISAEQEAAQLREQNKRLQRDLVFGRVGINTGEGTVGELFAAKYDGDLSEDAVRAAAAKYDLLPKAQATTTGGDEPTPEQVAAAQRMQQAGQGGEHTSGASDLERELSELPRYGHPDWAQGRGQFHQIIQNHGGRVERQRLTKQETRAVNPMTGRPMKGTAVPVTEITPP